MSVTFLRAVAQRSADTRLCASPTDQPTSLTDLPEDVWPAVCVDLHAFVHLPLTCKAMLTMLDDPPLRAKCLQALLRFAAAEEAELDRQAAAACLEALEADLNPAAVSSGPVPLARQLERRADIRRLRQHVTRLARRSIERHESDAFRQCVELFGFSVGHTFADGATALELSMRHDFADGAELLLRSDELLLPPPGGAPGSLARRINDDGDLGIGRLHPVEAAGTTVFELAKLGNSLSGFNPLFLGVLHHAHAATARVVSVLRQLRAVRQTGAAANLHAGPHAISGVEYLEAALKATYTCCSTVAMPFFGCGFAGMRFAREHGPAPMQMAMQSSGLEKRTTWSLLQLEMRRADTSADMVALLLRAWATEGAQQAAAVGAAAATAPPSGWPHPDLAPLGALIAGKRRAIALLEAGVDLQGAVQDARRRRAELEAAAAAAGAPVTAAAAAPRHGEPSSSPAVVPPAAVDPDAVLLDAGWFGANASEERVAQFEAAVALLEEGVVPARGSLLVRCGVDWFRYVT